VIHTVTLNPTLDITHVVEEVSFREPVKAPGVHESPGGKGINVSRALISMSGNGVTSMRRCAGAPPAVGPP